MLTIERIAEHLSVDQETATEIRAILDLTLVKGERVEREKDSPSYETYHDSPSRKLYMVDRLKTGTHGVEVIRSANDTPTDFNGISYLNTGDSYGATLLFDHGKNKWKLSTWADEVERNERRFAE